MFLGGCDGKFFEHIDAEDNPLVGDYFPITEVMRVGRGKKGPASLRVKSGKIVFVRLHTIPFRDEDEVGIAGERIRKLVHGYKISWWGDTLHVTVSLGATNVHSNDSVESLIGRAERALQAGLRPGQVTQIRGFAD